MKEFIATLGDNGRLIVPAFIRKNLELKAGDQVIIRLLDDNSIAIHSPKHSLKKLQNLLKTKGEGSLVDSLIEMRRKEEI
jgi:AbrB family looped-hinge helix DNA binding protein